MIIWSSAAFGDPAVETAVALPVAAHKRCPQHPVEVPGDAKKMTWTITTTNDQTQGTSYYIESKHCTQHCFHLPDTQVQPRICWQNVDGKEVINMAKYNQAQQAL